MNKIMAIPISTLAVLSMFFISFSFINIRSVHAESSSVQASLALDSVIDISAPSTITLNCAPGSTDATAQLCTSTANIVVDTNNVTGYTLQMNATNGSPTALTNSAASPAATIPTLSQAYTAANFPVNYWGYTGGTNKSSETGGYDCSTNYCPILAYNSNSSAYAPNHTIRVTDAPSNNSTTTLTFAGKVNTTKPSGTYSTSVTFTAVTNAVPAPAMQDFDTTACANATTDQTFILRDARDDTEYTVAKLQDGNCWMTQNLELGSAGKSLNLTPADSNVPSSGYNLSNVFTQYKGNSNHYGNYYEWGQATAGSGMTSGNDPYDICPKGWRLPSAGSSNATITTENEAYIMLSYYITTGTWNGTYWSGTTTSEWTSAPVSLVFSGEIIPPNDMEGQGNYGVWWLANVNRTVDAFTFLGGTSGSLSLRDLSDRYNKATIRCLIPST